MLTADLTHDDLYLSTKPFVDELYKNEINKFALGLIERNIPFVYRRLYDGMQIICEGFDVICHSGSMGHFDGRLEIMGKYAKIECEGFLTAEELLKRIDADNK